MFRHKAFYTRTLSHPIASTLIARCTDLRSDKLG